MLDIGRAKVIFSKEEMDKIVEEKSPPLLGYYFSNHNYNDYTYPVILEYKDGFGNHSMGEWVEMDTETFIQNLKEVIAFNEEYIKKIQNEVALYKRIVENGL